MMQNRDEIWSGLEQTWDVLVIGGGITGAGILREAVRLGLRALLVEQKDFAWGTSSRSSKLVHGGLRYLKEGKVGLTRASVLERQELLEEGPGLIDPLGCLLTIYEGDFPGRWTFELGLSIYDLLALQWDHRYYQPEDLRLLAPHIALDDLQGGFRYGDAQTDDARLVLRVIQEAVNAGATAMNYVSAEFLLRDADGQVIGARLLDQASGNVIDVHARAVVNATGAWADRLRRDLGARERIRPLRGSHLIFPAWRLPVAQSVGFLHPLDHRPVFIFPWEGITLVGTTDVDFDRDLQEEPAISPQEVAYLMAAVEAQFPSLHIGLEDVISTFAGVRPVIGSGKADPSKESRDHVVWEESGLLTVTGGKLTTFRIIARDALRALHNCLPGFPELPDDVPVLEPIDLNLPGAEALDESVRRRLLGRYGAAAVDLVAAAQPGELQAIPDTPVLWAELRWTARSESVLHLDDLLLRRVRLGLFLPRGGAALLPAVRRVCQPELGWDDARWQAEEQAYCRLVQRCYSLPALDAIPDWRRLLAQERQRKAAKRADFQKRQNQAARAGILLAVAGVLVGVSWLWQRRKTVK